MKTKGYVTNDEAVKLLEKYCGSNRRVLVAHPRACLINPEERWNGQTVWYSFYTGCLYYEGVKNKVGEIKLDRVYILNATDKGIAFLCEGGAGRGEVHVAVMTEDSVEASRELLDKVYIAYNAEHASETIGRAKVADWEANNTATVTESKSYTNIGDVLSSGERFVYIRCDTNASGNMMKFFCEVKPMRDTKGFVHLYSAKSECRLVDVAPFDEISVMNIEHGKDGEVALCWKEKGDERFLNYLFAL